mgnify:CR=1 FL=1
MYAPRVVPAYNASQQLMDVLVNHDFTEMPLMGGRSLQSPERFVSGCNYYFRKRGQCTINFLKDGRVHVLNGPIAIWNLHDHLSHHELAVLMAFGSLEEEHQECMRNYMGPRCTRYGEVLEHLPSFQVDWKEAFVIALSELSIAA